jgi:hypothetical protein
VAIMTRQSDDAGRPSATIQSKNLAFALTTKTIMYTVEVTDDEGEETTKSPTRMSASTRW